MDTKETKAAKKEAIALLKKMNKTLAKNPLATTNANLTLDPKKLIEYLKKGVEYMRKACDLLDQIDPEVDDVVYKLEDAEAGA